MKSNQTMKIKIALFILIIQSISACGIYNTNTGIDIIHKENILNRNKATKDIEYQDINIIQTTVLTENEEFVFKLEKNTDRLYLPFNAQNYKLFEINDSDKDLLYYKIQSYIDLNKDLNETTSYLTVALPIVAIMNNDFTLSRFSTPSNYSLSQIPFWENRESIYLFIRIDRKLNKNEKYILLLTSNELTNNSILNIYKNHELGGVTLSTQNGNKISATSDGEFLIKQVTGFFSTPFDRAIKF